MAKISAIIVNYNTGKLLTKAVQSIISYRGIEVIVIDNDSRDNSIKHLEQSINSKKLTIIKNKDNIGFGKAVNQAVKHATGNYIYLLNPDAEVSSQSLARMVKTSSSFNNNCIVAPRLENPDGTPQASCYRPQTILNAIREFWLQKKSSYQKFLPRGKKPIRVHAAVAAAWLIPVEVWKKLGGFNQKYFLYFEDLDFCDRLKQADIPVIYDPQAVVRHHHGVSSETNPLVMKLFSTSALQYHGRFKKVIIDLVIKLSNLSHNNLSGKQILILYLLWIAFINALAAIGYFLLPAVDFALPFLSNIWRSNFLIWSWANFDGEHYLTIAKYGYGIRNSFPQYAFFPLFPFLIKALSLLTRDVFLSSRIITLTSGYLVIYYLYKWLNVLKVKHHFRFFLLLFLFPGSLFFHAVYSEGLFIALTLYTFYQAEQKNWWKAVFSAMLATATRVNGIFLVPFLFVKLLKDKKSILQATLISATSSLGLLGYMLFLKFTTNDFFTFYTSQDSWGKAQLTSPLVTLAGYFRALTTDFTLDLTHAVVVLEVVITVWMFYLLIRSIRNRYLSAAYILYSGANLLLPILTGSLGSMPRFSLLLFPLFIGLELLPPKQYRLLLSIYLITLAFGTILFTRGYWYA